jgi:hypothetical protein
MINCTRYALALAITLCALVVSTHAQTLPGAAVAHASAGAPPSPTAVGTITGEGTAGKIAKFTGTNATGDSVLTESAGRIGLGTAAPAQSLHVLGLTSGLRLQSTGGMALTTTDYAGNGKVWQSGVGGANAAGGVANKFFVRDLSANQYRMVFDTTGNVGIGTTQPSAKLQVVAADGHAIRGESNTGADGVSGASKTGRGVYGESGTGAGVWGKSSSLTDQTAGVVGINTSGGWSGFFFGPVKVVGGCDGCTAAPSDRALKANITAVNPRSVLDRLAALPIGEWSYKSDEPSTRHLGPMAQDFRAAFQLGADDKHIDLIDANGVTMAAIQGLYQQNQELAAEVRQLRAQMARQQAQLNQVRRAVRGRAVRR